jgi:XTP/dITP diphosphohydrolase
MAELRLYLASTNRGKLREFRDAGRACSVQVEPLPRIRSIPACVEDGTTFEANARKKALHYAAQSSGLVFADDSGISVDALGGAPGIHSARYSGSSDAANNRKLLRELRRRVAQKPLPEGLYVPIDASPYRGFPAHYSCVIALAEDQRLIALVEGRCDGVIIETPRGRGGFGYDPYFFYPPLHKTFAEISARQKFAVSHRGNAFRRLLEVLPSQNSEKSGG